MAGEQDGVVVAAGDLADNVAVDMSDPASSRVSSVHTPASSYRLPVDAAKSFVEINTLISRWTIQLFSSLAKSGYDVPFDIRKTVVSYVVTGVAAALTTGATRYNYVHRHDEVPPALESYIAAAFSSSLLYLGSEFVSGSNNTFNLSAFGIASALIPFFGFLIARSAIPDKSTTSVMTVDFNQLQSQLALVKPGLSEKLYQAFFSGIEYGSTLPLLIWEFNRERAGSTVPTPFYQLVIAGLGMTGCAFAGYNARTIPKLISHIAPSSAALKTAAYTYMTMSGLLSMVLDLCDIDLSEMDPGIRIGFIVVCVLPALILAADRFLKTQFRFDAWHSDYERTAAIAETIRTWVTALPNLFSRCAGNNTARIKSSEIKMHSRDPFDDSELSEMTPLLLPTTDQAPSSSGNSASATGYSGSLANSSPPSSGSAAGSVASLWGERAPSSSLSSYEESAFNGFQR